LQVRRRSRLFLLICHVANADGGEAMLFDKSGAARSAKREDTVLSNRVARGGRQRLTLTTQGVWLAQIPRAKTVKKRRGQRPRHNFLERFFAVIHGGS